MNGHDQKRLNAKFAVEKFLADIKAPKTFDGYVQQIRERRKAQQIREPVNRAQRRAEVASLSQEDRKDFLLKSQMKDRLAIAQAESLKHWTKMVDEHGSKLGKKISENLPPKAYFQFMWWLFNTLPIRMFWFLSANAGSYAARLVSMLLTVLTTVLTIVLVWPLKTPMRGVRVFFKTWPLVSKISFDFENRIYKQVITKRGKLISEKVWSL